MEFEVDFSSVKRGSFGAVYRVVDKKTRKEYALKVIEGNMDDTELKREVENLRKCKSCFILPLVEYYPDGVDPFKGNRCILTNFIKNGSLYDYLKKNSVNNSTESIDWGLKLIWSYGIARGISYLHENRIIHRDLKPMNILLDENLYPIICDLGIAKETQPGHTSSQTNNMGTVMYMAPENIEGKRYNYKNDVFSFGIILYNIFVGDNPWTNIGRFQIQSKIVSCQRPVIPDSIPEKISKLIKECWAQNPEERPSINEIINKLEDKSSIFHDNALLSKYITVIPNLSNESSELFFYYHNIYYREYETHDRNTQLELGNFYLEGEYVERDINKAIHYYKLASDQNEPRSQAKLGYIYLEEKDYRNSYNYHKLAADQNNGEGFLGLYYLYNDGLGVKKNPNEAIRYLRLAIGQNNTDALYSLGKEYIKGKSVQKSYIEAANHFKIAANRNHTKASFELGCLYYYGNGIDQNITEAKKYIKQAADQNDINSQNMLGYIYKKEKNYIESIRYYKIPADLNDIMAQYQLGLVYKDGKEPNLIEAARYLKFAADQNHPDAQFEIAKLFYDGNGVNKNHNEATRYLEFAANQGHEDAIKLLEQVRKDKCNVY